MARASAISLATLCHKCLVAYSLRHEKQCILGVSFNREDMALVGNVDTMAVCAGVRFDKGTSLKSKWMLEVVHDPRGRTIQAMQCSMAPLQMAWQYGLLNLIRFISTRQRRRSVPQQTTRQSRYVCTFDDLPNMMGRKWDYCSCHTHSPAAHQPQVVQMDRPL